MKTLEEVNIEVSKYGMEILEYHGALGKAKVLCRNGHFLFRRYIDVKNGHNCPLCSPNLKYSEDRIDRIVEESGLVKIGDYVDKDTPLKLQCLKCDTIFNRRIFNIKKKCPTCLTISRLGELHGYKWTKTVSSGWKDGRFKHVLICPNNHIFEVASNDWKKGNRCTTCNSSKQEGEIRKILEVNKIKYKYRDRKMLDGLELDFLLENNCAIEFNGDHWHSVSRVGKAYHQNKSLKAYNKNIKILHIYERLWEENKEEQTNRLLKFIFNETTQPASQIEVVKIDNGIPLGCTIIKIFPPRQIVKHYKCIVFDSGNARIKHPRASKH